MATTTIIETNHTWFHYRESFIINVLRVTGIEQEIEMISGNSNHHSAHAVLMVDQLT